MEKRRGREGKEMRAASEALFFLLLFLLLWLSCCLGDLRVGAQILPQQEVDALRQIAIKLRKGEKEWDFSINPCSGLGGWVNVTGLLASNVTCDCSFDNNTTCHVISLVLKRQNLTGILPEEIANLTQLRFLDISRNYLSGSIPAAWASLPLFNLSLHVNQLSGKIPKELGNMAVLKSLVLENNQLEGPLPPELGNLSSLQRLFISGNNITGELPISFAKLTNMTDFRIDGNPISGRIPDFIQNWRSVNRIDMQGTSMDGPIPSSISFLKNLTEFRVSDLNGPSTSFPPLQNAEHLTELVIRNCSISGEIPSYMGTMEYLKVLDLSFNELTGQIPSNFDGLAALEYLYLTDNMLTGQIPSWMLRNKPSNKKNMDISYNKFTRDPPTSCQEGNVNMVASFSSTEDNSILPCLRKNHPCQRNEHYSSVFINCGGKKIVVGVDEYEDDSSQIGTSTFHADESGRWAYSSTGDFTGNEDAYYIATNTSVLNMTNPELYMEARLAPLSLKYYGLCLENGNYSVNLHFSEITFTADQTYSSLGKRIFDVLIQGQRVLENFNIEEIAGGPGRAIIVNFTASVTDNTLEIHLYWAGKGTTAIPERGVYGPLISAISVIQKSNDNTGHDNLSIGAILGIVAASCLVIIFILTYIWIKGCFRGPQGYNTGYHATEVQTRSQYYFSIKQIEAATNNFDAANKIGEGGFGPVYKGQLVDGTLVAVKQLSSKSRQGSREFLNEIGMISALQHPNLVKIFGCCIEENQLLLLYEYMENNSLGRALFGRDEHRLKLDWPTRYMICLGIAKGLTYLHEESMLRIVHRDIKPANILLDENLSPKISDFGLAKLDEEEHSHISTRVAGTVGYMAPEYATRGYLTEKADVYSYGVVVLEIVSGKSNTNYIQNEKFFCLLDWALVLLKQGRLIELVDRNLGSDYSNEEVLRTLNVALLCTNQSPTMRPAMSTVVGMLAGQTPIPDPLEHSLISEDWRFDALKEFSLESQRHNSLVDRATTDTSVSLHTDEEVASLAVTRKSFPETH